MDAMFLAAKAMWKPVTGLLLAGAVAASFHFRVATVESDMVSVKEADVALLQLDSARTASYHQTVQLLVPMARFMCLTDAEHEALLMAVGLPCEELLQGVEVPR